MEAAPTFSGPSMPGKVYLVGAGPGDPGLLTVKGRRLLESADCVVYDYLANPRLLDLAPAHAELILAGKHGGGEHVPQDTINAILIDRAQRYGTIVRLKGGDPFVFGRGAEEALALRRAGIDYAVVPGVSSAVAVPAYAGIPVTHRDFASSLVVTTGYEYPGKAEAAVRWRDLAGPGHTIVLLMTTRQLGTNLQRLIDGGLDPSTPAALIEWGTRADQRTIEAPVGELAEAAERNHVKPPALAVIGEVVGLRRELNWWEHAPLFGRRIVVTRPRHQAAELGDLLERDGAEVISLPTIEIAAPESMAPLDAAIERATEFDWVIFTSANGVRVFFERLQTLQRDIRAWHRARLAAIGPQTARALRAFGVQVEVIPADFRAEGLLDSLAVESLAGQRVLLPRAGGAREILPDELRRRGALVEEVVTYVSRAPATAEADFATWLDRGVDVVTFTSSSTVEQFARILGPRLPEAVRSTTFASIGPVTTATARRLDIPIAIEPEAYTMPALAEAIVRHFRGRPPRRTVLD